MCGIVGVYYQDSSKKVQAGILTSMSQTLRHRGPDDSGIFVDANIGLGVTRLSVIDLARGHQPIHNEDGGLQVILNGEIYNYPELRQGLMQRGHLFYTDSDTEVIVHLFEEKRERCVDDLNGMFSFAVVDTKTRELFVARDRLGIKPLYYYHKDRLFIFGSEIKAIIDFPGLLRGIDLESLFSFLSLNYVPGPRTMFKDIRQLEAGHCIKVTENSVAVRKYWDLDFPETMHTDEDEIIREMMRILRASVKRMLRSDVPLGAFLSGGVDSSSLVSLICENSAEPLKTFSVGFKEDTYDESRFAGLAANHFNTEHFRTVCRPQDVIEALPKLAWYADNLLADPAMLPLYLVSRMAKAHVTVCISGDGGDELFAGYPTYLADNYLRRYQRLPLFVRKFIIERLARSLPASTDKLSFDYKVKKFVEGAAFNPDKAHYWWRTVFSDKEKQSLLTAEALKEANGWDAYSAYSHCYENPSLSNAHALNKFFYADIKVWLTDNNLIRVDAMSMANSLEARVPFLDHELVEFSAKIHPYLKMKNGSLKYILKKAMQPRLPREIIGRAKSGWHVPLARWFKTDLLDYVADTLNSSKAINSGLFNKQSIAQLLKEHSEGRSNNAFKIWGLLVFAHWYNSFG